MKSFQNVAPLALLACGALGMTALATDSTPDVQDDAAEEVAEEENPLHESMEILQQNLRAMRKLMRDPEMKDEALAACRAMEGAVLVGLQNIPEPQEGDLAEQSAFEYQLGFKQRMHATYGTLLELEVALEAGDGDSAKDLYRALGAHKKDGHDAYYPD